MKLAIMQPYFFPYLGYFQLMNYVDKWVVFDDIQFIDKGWINRNRILHPEHEKEWQYITVPLDKRGQFDHIVDINIKKESDWVDTIMGKLSIYKRKAPYYEQTCEFVRDCLSGDDYNLSKMLIRILSKTALALGINTPLNVQSEMAMDLPEINHPGQWALEISKFLHASDYVNPTSGSHIFKEEEFNQVNIKLHFLKPKLSNYIQRRGDFVSGLSIIDIMMWNDKPSIQDMLKHDFTILNKEEIENGQY